jgi:hypothetical protein
MEGVTEQSFRLLFSSLWFNLYPGSLLRATFLVFYEERNGTGQQKYTNCQGRDGTNRHPGEVSPFRRSVTRAGMVSVRENSIPFPMLFFLTRRFCY